MNIWLILGIGETKDKNELKKAYRRKLTVTNPEDNPEGFMELRAAYEEAVRLADLQDDRTNISNSELDLLQSELESLYKDYWRRLDVKCWEKLFDSDIFISLSTSEEAFKQLIKFLLSHFYLPRQVWSLICETFDIIDRRRELSEIIPEDFVDYMINNAGYDDILDYNLIEGNVEEFDSFIELYYYLDSAIRHKDIEKQKGLLQKMEALNVSHPYKLLAQIRHRVQALFLNNRRPDIEELRIIERELEELNEEYPDTIPIINCCGDIEMLMENFGRAKDFYDASYKLSPDNYIVMGKQAEIELALGNFKRSRDIYLDLLKINHYDNNVRAGMIRANQGLIEMYRKKIDENPQDNESRIEMAWSLYQSYSFEEAIRVLDEFEPSEEKLCEYNNLKGRSYLCLERLPEALECFEIWKKSIEAIPEEDVSREALAKRKRYEYVNFLIADCYLKQKKYDKARELFEVALKKEHDEILLTYEAMCELEYNTKNYEDCILACERLLKRDNRSYIAYDYIAKAQYNLGFYNEAVGACERAISIYPYVSEPYTLEMKIFLEVNQPEGAVRALNRFRVYGIDSDNVDYYEALLLERDGKYKEAMILLEKTIERSNIKATDMKSYEDLYFLYGNICEKQDEMDNAKKAFNKVAEINPNHKLVYGKIGMLLRNEGKYAEAYEMFTKQLEINPQAYYYIQRGVLNKISGNYKSALGDFQAALKYEPDNSYCHTRIGQLFEYHREFEKALASYDMAMNCLIGDDKDLSSQRKYIMVLKARTLQCMKRFQESRQIYEEYLSKYSLNSDVAYDYARLLQRMNEIKAAIDILLECVEKLKYDNEMSACLGLLIRIYGEEGYLDKANETFMLALSKNDNDIRARAMMARILREKGIFDTARELYAQCVALDTGSEENYYCELIELLLTKKGIFKPDISEYLKKAEKPLREINNPQNILKLARLYRARGDYKRALECVNKALNNKRCQGCFYSKCHEALYAKALIYEKQKQYDLAALCYKEAIDICGHNAIYEERLKRIDGK